MNKETEYHETVVIGGGQAGLATGRYLLESERDFIILDAAEHTGDVWRNRWDSLRLHTPARFSSLPGHPFPGEPHYFPTKDEFADYLESYAAHFKLPIRRGVWVEQLTKESELFKIKAGPHHFEANNVVVAMSNYQVPKLPSFAGDLASGITQLHSSQYRNTSQLSDGGVLIVGAGNSGAEIGLEVARERPTWISGPKVGHIPFRIETRAARYFLVPLVLRGLFHYLLSLGTPIGRKARLSLLHKSSPLVRVKPSDLKSAGAKRVPRTVGIQDGKPVVGTGQTLDVANVIWCTGYRPNFSWIDLPIFNGAEDPKEPNHHRGIVDDVPGLYFVGLFFLYALSSSLVQGVGRDARYVVNHIVAKQVYS